MTVVFTHFSFAEGSEVVHLKLAVVASGPMRSSPDEKCFGTKFILSHIHSEKGESGTVRSLTKMAILVLTFGRGRVWALRGAHQTGGGRRLVPREAGGLLLSPP